MARRRARGARHRVHARTQHGQIRDGAAVAELHTLDLSGWPPGTRAIARREPLHPGAQTSFLDADGHRVTVFITDQPDADIAGLQRRHRGHARVEDRIRTAKATGLGNLPHRDFARNEVWLELALVACDLLAWTQRLTLDGDLAAAEPKTLRYGLLHVAARVTSHARQQRLRLQRTWPTALLDNRSRTDPGSRRCSRLPESQPVTEITPGETGKPSRPDRKTPTSRLWPPNEQSRLALSVARTVELTAVSKPSQCDGAARHRSPDRPAFDGRSRLTAALGSPHGDPRRRPSGVPPLELYDVGQLGRPRSACIR